MFKQLRSAVATLEAVVRDLDPGEVDGRGAIELVDLFTKVEHLGAAGKAFGAKRVDQTGAYRATGHRSAGDWLASRSGVAVSAAVHVLETVESLAELPATREAFRAGKLSEAQAHEITGAAQKDPGAEAELLAATPRTTMKGLKDRCRRVRAGAEVDDAAWAQHLRNTRHLWQWSESDGAAAGMWRMAPDRGAEVKAAIDAETDLIFREARRAGTREAREAYAADALHALITRGPRKATSASVVLDAAAKERGYVVDGERCEITGVGPIPVTIAREMLEDAKVREIPASFADLPDDTSTSRYLPVWMEAWLDARYPTCGVAGCDAHAGLEYDHVIPLEEGGATAIDNLWRICRYHHQRKHRDHWRVTGSVPAWVLLPPDPPDDPDPP